MPKANACSPPSRPSPPDSPPRAPKKSPPRNSPPHCPSHDRLPRQPNDRANLPAAYRAGHRRPPLALDRLRLVGTLPASHLGKHYRQAHRVPARVAHSRNLRSHRPPDRPRWQSHRRPRRSRRHRAPARGRRLSRRLRQRGRLLPRTSCQIQRRALHPHRRTESRLPTRLQLLGRVRSLCLASI